MSHIKGIAVTLYEVTNNGKDEFNKDKIVESPVVIQNVLIAPLSETEIVETMNLYGKKAIYQLGIPKGDTHEWENRKVSFFGQTFRTVGAVQEGIEEMIPLSWHKKIRAERISNE